jgi:hypothetical protein
MTIESEFQSWNVTATEDLSAASRRFKAVSIFGTIAGTNALALGIMRSGNVLGGQVSVVVQGITKAVCATVITTPGWPISITGSGFIAPATTTASGGSVGTGHIGRYLGLAAAASGDLVPVLVNFTQVSPWANA